MASTAASGAGVLGEGLRIMGRAIRAQPRVFAVAGVGGLAFGLLVVAGAFVVGGVVGAVVVPAFDRRQVVASSLALGAAALMGLSLVQIGTLFTRRLAAGAMQYRLQASYRRQVTQRYLELPLAWHRRNAT